MENIENIENNKIEEEHVHFEPTCGKCGHLAHCDHICTKAGCNCDECLCPACLVK